MAAGDAGFGTDIGIENEAEIRFHDCLDHPGEDDGIAVVPICIERLQNGGVCRPPPASWPP